MLVDNIETALEEVNGGLAEYFKKLEEVVRGPNQRGFKSQVYVLKMLCDAPLDRWAGKATARRWGVRARSIALR